MQISLLAGILGAKGDRLSNFGCRKFMKKRLRLVIEGVVQGVGFRPFIYCLATELELKGWVNNSARGVFIEVEGERSQSARLRQIALNPI